jgi:hypothetical protein
MAQTVAHSTKQQARVDEKFRTTTELCERSKMAEIYKRKLFERLEYKNIKKEEKSMQQGKRMRAGTRNYYFFTWPYLIICNARQFYSSRPAV